MQCCHSIFFSAGGQLSTIPNRRILKESLLFAAKGLYQNCY